MKSPIVVLLAIATAMVTAVGQSSHPPQGTGRSIVVGKGATQALGQSDWGFADPSDSPPNSFSGVRITTVPQGGTLRVGGEIASAGQVVATVADSAWVFRDGATTAQWRYIAASADGTRLSIVGWGLPIYTSADSGATWTPRDATPSHVWQSIASSSDGTRLAALAFGQHVYTSTDAGATWTVRTGSPSGVWWQWIASSADGTRLLAVVYGGSIYTSADSGATWTECTGAPSGSWVHAISSSDGTRLAAGLQSGLVYVSADSGATWTARSSESHGTWPTLASSADGTRMAVSYVTPGGGAIYTSQDGGATWTHRSQAPQLQWSCLVSSSDGTRLTAAAVAGGIYGSMDSGATWTVRSNVPAAVVGWLASSSDGSRLAAVVQGGGISTTDGFPEVTYTAPSVAGRYSLTFQVQDDGTTGANEDPTPRTLHFDVPSHAPMGADGQVTLAKGQGYTVAPAHWGFSDPNDQPADSFTGVRIAALPSGGTLRVGGVAVSPGHVLARGEAVTWTQRPNSPSAARSMASSGDGVKLAAAVDGGLISTSTDSGATWTSRAGAGTRAWRAVASSLDGTRLVAVAQGAGIYTSSDSGATWTERAGAGIEAWASVASSADGAKVAAVVDGGGIHTSADFGQTWTRQLGSSTAAWRSIASSWDGAKLAAATDREIYTSTDSGVTWTQRMSWQIYYNAPFVSITSSSDGTKLAAATGYGWLFTSTDSGATWVERILQGFQPEFTQLSYPKAVASSADGTRLVLGVWGGVLTSRDAGVTWARSLPTVEGAQGTQGIAWQLANNFDAVATSSDGLHLAASSAASSYTGAGGFPEVTYTAPTVGGRYSLAFQVQDDGLPGSNEDPTPRTFAFDVPSDAPLGTDRQVTLRTGQTLVLGDMDWGFGDPLDTPPNGLAGVRLTTLPARGGLRVQGAPAAAGQVVASGQAISYQASSVAGQDAFTFQVQDNGWLNPLDLVPNTFSVTVNNWPPEGTDGITAVPRSGTHVLAPATFGFQDPGDSTPNRFVGVKLGTLPSGGTLRVGGVDATPGQVVGPVASTELKGWKGPSGAVWMSIAASADGRVLWAAGRTAGLYVSSNAGSTWSPVTASLLDGQDLVSVASSKDGGTVAVGSYGSVFVSTDGGVTWARRVGPNWPFYWRAIACSANGTRIVAAGQGGHVIASSNSGVTWSRVGANLGNRNWSAIASSSDGTRLALAEFGGLIYTSADAGGTWTARTGPIGSRSWNAIATSADGSRLAAVSWAYGPGQIYTSADSGASWVERTTGRSLSNPAVPTSWVNRPDMNAHWMSVASSSDGNVLAVVAGGGNVFVSRDGGVSWDEHAKPEFWQDEKTREGRDRGANAGVADWTSAALSSDGLRLVAGDGDARLFMVDASPKLPQITYTAPSQGGPQVLTFQVLDDGVGENLDPSPNTLVFQVNDSPPSGTDGVVTLAKGQGYTFTASNWGYTDPLDAPANVFVGVRIASLPTSGVLRVNGQPASVGQVAGLGDAIAYEAAATAGTDGFTFQVQDDGWSHNVDPTPNRLTLTVRDFDPGLATLMGLALEFVADGVDAANEVQTLLDPAADANPGSPGGPTVFQALAGASMTGVQVRALATSAGATLRVRVGDGAFAPLQNGVAGGPLPLAVGVNPVQVEVTSSDGISTVTYAMGVRRLNNIEDWRRRHFGSIGNSGAAADVVVARPDNLSNLEKFAFGLDPHADTGRPVQVLGSTILALGKPTVSVESTSATSIGVRARFVRRKTHLADGLTYTVRFAGELGNVNAWRTSTVAPTVVASDGDYEVVEVPYPLFINGRKAGYFKVDVGTAP